MYVNAFHIFCFGCLTVGWCYHTADIVQALQKRRWMSVCHHVRLWFASSVGGWGEVHYDSSHAKGQDYPTTLGRHGSLINIISGLSEPTNLVTPELLPILPISSFTFWCESLATYKHEVGAQVVGRGETLHGQNVITAYTHVTACEFDCKCHTILSQPQLASDVICAWEIGLVIHLQFGDSWVMLRAQFVMGNKQRRRRESGIT